METLIFDFFTFEFDLLNKELNVQVSDTTGV